ncbi:MAG TPA: DNA-processing protein DprA [Solirubrobacteraceae bacterium]|nr:DNA-processing protein DprA [Solirubrobacteraceae bacterium]
MRRSWLLAQLSAPLDYCARDRDRLLALLGLADEQLIGAVGGRRKQELAALYQAFSPDGYRVGQHVQTICRHRSGYPRLLGAASAPHMLNVVGRADRLRVLTGGHVVALVGSRGASDYGIEMARSIARGLGASAVTVSSGLVGEIALAAHEGAIEGRGATVAVSGDGLGSCPAGRRSLLRRVTRDGCAVSELACECRGRRWGQLASERTIVGLAALTIVVEARETAEDLAPARIARALGRQVAAIPGRVTSPLSCGTNVLLMEGAKLVRGAADVLELLCLDAPQPQAQGLAQAPPQTLKQTWSEQDHAPEPRLQRILERVGMGADTPQKLAKAGVDTAEAMLALSELELMGLLGRGHGGRYVPLQPWHVDN